MEAIPLGFRLTKVNSTHHRLLLDLIYAGSWPVTGLASGKPANATESYAHKFALTLSTILTCDVPLRESCEANNNQLNESQWDAFRVSLACSPSFSLLAYSLLLY